MINEYNIFSVASTRVFSTLALYGKKPFPFSLFQDLDLVVSYTRNEMEDGGM